MTAQQKRECELAHRALHPRGAPPQVIELPNVGWSVQQQADEGFVMTLFTGPWSEWRARQYARAAILPGAADTPALAAGEAAP